MTKIIHHASTASRRAPRASHHVAHTVPVPVVQPSVAHLFTKEENNLYKILSKNRSESIWGYSIRDVCRDVRVHGNIPRFRKLIACLQAQAKDCADTMKLIIGEEGYKCLMDVKV